MFFVTVKFAKVNKLRVIKFRLISVFSFKLNKTSMIHDMFE